MKEQVDLIVTGASEGVTVSGGGDGPLCGHAMDDCGVVREGAVAMRDGVVVAVDERSVLDAVYEGQHVLDARGGTILPGLIDPHTHPVFAATREEEFDMRAKGATYQEITASGGGIFSSVRSLRETPRDQLESRLKIHLDRFLACGTTTIEAKSGYGLSLEHEILSLELLMEADVHHRVDIDPTCLAAHQVPPEFQDDREAYVDLVVNQILPEVSRRGIARSADVFCDEGAFTVEESRAVLAGAQKVGLDLRVHADELAPVGAAELAAQMGARTADHLVMVSPEGIDAMVNENVTPILLPGTSFSLRLPNKAPADAMIEAGLPLALASDFNPGTCHISSMIEIIALACGTLGLTVAQALVAATRNGAETLGVSGVRGRIQPGALADLVLLDVPNHLFLGYQMGWNPVRAVVKNGEVAWQR